MGNITTLDLTLSQHYNVHVQITASAASSHLRIHLSSWPLPAVPISIGHDEVMNLYDRNALTNNVSCLCINQYGNNKDM